LQGLDIDIPAYDGIVYAPLETRVNLDTATIEVAQGLGI